MVKKVFLIIICISMWQPYTNLVILCIASQITIVGLLLGDHLSEPERLDKPHATQLFHHQNYILKILKNQLTSLTLNGCFFSLLDENCELFSIFLLN